jgi:hypothetical protein
MYYWTGKVPRQQEVADRLRTFGGRSKIGSLHPRELEPGYGALVFEKRLR